MKHAEATLPRDKTTCPETNGKHGWAKSYFHTWCRWCGKRRVGT